MAKTKTDRSFLGVGEVAVAPQKEPQVVKPPVPVEDTREEVMGDLRSALLEEGIKMSKKGMVRAPNKVWEVCAKSFKEIEFLQGQPIWSSFNSHKRFALKTLRVFLRQLMGLPVPPGEAASVAEYFTFADRAGGLGMSAAMQELPDADKAEEI